MSSSIAKRLAKNLGEYIEDSNSDALLIIPENSISDLYAKRFCIESEEDLKKFHEAFRICTEGQGNELKSINNIISSALLPLLTFFRLFGENSGFSLNLKINGVNIEFDRCFFEVRNKVINFPSCIDVALYSSKNKVMLFLESKLSEYNRVSKDLEIKKGYLELYNEKVFQYILKLGNICVEGNKMKLSEGDNAKAYFEGIKQSISHLIGLVQGPSDNNKGVFYPTTYLRDYKNCYKKANTIYYATIILDPNEIGATDFKSSYANYVELYIETIGENGKTIIDCIRNWPMLKNDTGKEIIVIKEPLSYHEVFKVNHSLLLPKIQKLYQL